MNQSKFDQLGTTPWGAILTRIDDPAHHDVFVGNGRIGIRVPIEGETSPYPECIPPYTAPSGIQMHGLWSMNSLVPAFNFMALSLEVGGVKFRRGNGYWQNYRQELDWRTATVKTSCDWQLECGTVNLEYQLYPVRHRPELCVVELSLSCDRPVNCAVVDQVDAEFIEDLEQPRRYFRNKICQASSEVFSARVGIRNVLAAAATEVVMPDSLEVRNSMSELPVGYQRRFAFRLQSGETIRIVKYAAFTSENETPDPVNAVLGIVASAVTRPNSVRRKHEAAWKELWQHNIEVDQPGLQWLIRNALYQHYCNLEVGSTHLPGPVGLSGNHWGGHAFWDNETWMYPVIAMLNPKLGKIFIDYRLRTLPGAQRNALFNGFRGAQIAWESAEFGDETIPDLVYAHQHHIVSDVALAAFQYYLITGDVNYISTDGAELIFNCAEFWMSRVDYIPELHRYEIHGVCCVDEYAKIQNNNASTNFGAAQTLRMAAKTAELIGVPSNPHWREVADKIYLPYDEKNGCYWEYDNYDGGTIKQADTTLMFYPWMCDTDRECKLRTVEYYRDKYPEGKIMLGTTIDGIIAAEFGDSRAVWSAVLDLLPYYRGNFGIVTESELNEVGSFLTGQGGLLQLVVMGMGGLRLAEKGLQFYPPCLPDEVGWIKLNNFTWQGKLSSIIITKTGIERCKTTVTN